MTDSADVWTQVTLSLRSQLAESVWFSTFQDVSPLPSDDDTLRLLAPSGYVRDRIMSRYLPLVTEALQDARRAFEDTPGGLLLEGLKPRQQPLGHPPIDQHAVRGIEADQDDGRLRRPSSLPRHASRSPTVRRRVSPSRSASATLVSMGLA